MLASYGPIARRSAVVAAGAAVIMIVLCGLLGGAKGLLGSVLGAALVVGSVIGVLRTGDPNEAGRATTQARGERAMEVS